MATPTEIVTRTAARYLGDSHDVTFAMRVEWGELAIDSSRRGAMASASLLWTPLLLPVLAWKKVRQRFSAFRGDQSYQVGVLGLTAESGRVLLSSSPWRRKAVLGVIDELPAGSALLPDVDMLETYLVPTLTVGPYEFVVNSIDFKALLRAVETGVVTAPKLESELPRLKAVGRSKHD